MTVVSKLRQTLMDDYECLIDSYRQPVERYPRIMRIAQRILENPLDWRNQFADLQLLQRAVFLVQNDHKTATKISEMVLKLPFLPQNLPKAAGLILRHLDPATIKSLRLANKAWDQSVGLEDLFIAALAEDKNHGWENILIKVNNNFGPVYQELLCRLLRIFFEMATGLQQERLFRLDLNIMLNVYIDRLAALLPPVLDSLNFGVKGNTVIQLIKAIQAMRNPPVVNKIAIWRYFTNECKRGEKKIEAIFSLKPSCLMVESRVFLQDWLSKMKKEKLEALTATVTSLEIQDVMYEDFIGDAPLQLSLPCMPSIRKLTLKGDCFDPNMRCVPTIAAAYPNLRELIVRQSHVNNSPLEIMERLMILIKEFKTIASLDVIFNEPFQLFESIPMICDFVRSSQTIENLKFRFSFLRVTQRQKLEELIPIWRENLGLSLNYTEQLNESKPLIFEFKKIQRPMAAMTEEVSDDSSRSSKRAADDTTSMENDGLFPERRAQLSKALQKLNIKVTGDKVVIPADLDWFKDLAINDISYILRNSPCLRLESLSLFYRGLMATPPEYTDGAKSLEIFYEGMEPGRLAGQMYALPTNTPPRLPSVQRLKWEGVCTGGFENSMPSLSYHLPNLKELEFDLQMLDVTGSRPLNYLMCILQHFTSIKTLKINFHMAFETLLEIHKICSLMLLHPKLERLNFIFDFSRTKDAPDYTVASLSDSCKKAFNLNLNCTDQTPSKRMNLVLFKSKRGATEIASPPKKFKREEKV